MEIDFGILVDRHQERMRVAGEGVRDCPAYQRRRRCGRRLALLGALVPLPFCRPPVLCPLWPCVAIEPSICLFVYFSLF